jgi:hypothetical protein
VCGQQHDPAAFTPGKDPVPTVREAGWAPEPVWIGAENLAPPGFQPVVSRYTDYAITAPSVQNYWFLLLRRSLHKLKEVNVNCNFQQPFRMYHLQNHRITICDEILSLPYIGPIHHVMRHPRWTKWHCNKLSSEFLPFSLLVIVPRPLHTHHYRPLQCDILLTRKHFVTFSVFELGASCQLWHLAGCSEQRFSTGGTKV